MTDAIILLFQISGFVFALILAILSLAFLIVLIMGALRTIFQSTRNIKRDRQITKEIKDAVSHVNEPSRFDGEGPFPRDYERRRYPGSRR